MICYILMDSSHTEYIPQHVLQIPVLLSYTMLMLTEYMENVLGRASLEWIYHATVL